MLPFALLAGVVAAAPPLVLELDLFDEPQPAATNEATASTSAASSTPAFLLLTSYLLLGCPAPPN
jgi:hypothetical protein